jgi:alkanesulfonate monooxygenase SsuD/methylene tetrahydromethanopterin reductase-like flavin-dependent oxidoreductase (luciferase family)
MPRVGWELGTVEGGHMVDDEWPWSERRVARFDELLDKFLWLWPPKPARD